MSSRRQSELFAGQDWQVLYRAFAEINFNATDPASINEALRQYIRVNYPEDFNDWIESSEFVAIIDLLSWLAGTLAYKIDINARENFMETAEARESILRLARFLSYNPSRNLPATGLVKLVEVSSNDDLVDANGRSLTNRQVSWNNADDPDWYDNFVTILNSAFISTNPFGTALKTGTVGETPTQLYRVNSRMGDNDFKFNSRVAGQGMDFEIVNGDFTDGEIFEERTPDPNAAFHMYYRNDGNGNGSPNTGFFMLFKQGSLRRKDFNIQNPIENQILDIDSTGVTENDLWVQNFDGNGNITRTWDRVPSVFSENITFNSLPAEQRNIYSVIGRDNDQVSIRFSDGIFGNAPVGNIGVWYRVANGEQYTIRPFDIQRIRHTMTYINRSGVERTINLVFSLYSPVSNSTSRETNDDIKRRASAVYSTQSRMVSGEDYNLFPLSSNSAVKIKAVNRTYSGHSRHIDLNDPTSTYQDTNVFSDDGAIYYETDNVYQETPTFLNRSPSELLNQFVSPTLDKTMVRNHILVEQVERALNENHPLHVEAPNGTWTQSSGATFSSTGYFSENNAFYKDGANIRFVLPDGTKEWASIVRISGPSTQAPFENNSGPITLSQNIPTGSTMDAIILAYHINFTDSDIATIENKFDLGLAFSLWFDPISSRWLIEDYSDISDNISPPSLSPSAIRLLSVENTSGVFWKIVAAGTRMVFESMRKIKWFHNTERVIDTNTGARRLDTISVLPSNVDLNNGGLALQTPSVFNTHNIYFYLNGTSEPRRIEVVFTDDDEDGEHDKPDALYRLISPESRLNRLFWRKDESSGCLSYIPEFNVSVFQTILSLNESDNMEGRIAYVFSDNDFYINDGTEWILQNDREFRVAVGRGPNVAKDWTDEDETNSVAVDPLSFQWKHYANTNHRIDPSRTSIIDIFVLTSEYDFLTREWILNGADAKSLPAPPSELDLRLMFRTFEDFKMATDEIVWRPVQYKFLFGTGSEDSNLRSKFKVVKLQNTTVSDGEIKSRVIRAINEYFDVTRWEFGETFYFTELAAFVHQRLASVIGSFVIVPINDDASFGDGFEVSARSDEIFVSTAQVADVEIINSNTADLLRIR